MSLFQEIDFTNHPCLIQQKRDILKNISFLLFSAQAKLPKSLFRVTFLTRKVNNFDFPLFYQYQDLYQLQEIP